MKKLERLLSGVRFFFGMRAFVFLSLIVVVVVVVTVVVVIVVAVFVFCSYGTCCIQLQFVL